MKRLIGYEIKSLNNILERKIMEVHKEEKQFSITTTQIQIIDYLLKNKEAYQNDLEKFLKIRRSTISGILNTMEKNSLIKRIKKDKDARVNKIILTDNCLYKFEKVKEKVIIFDKQLKENISDEELSIFFDVIEKIKNNISK